MKDILSLRTLKSCYIHALGLKKILHAYTKIHTSKDYAERLFYWRQNL